VSNFKKLQQVETTIVFLTRCQNEKILPTTFKIPLKLPHLNPKDEIIAKNVLNQTSRTLLKLALNSRKTLAEDLNKAYWSSWHDLINLKKGKEQETLINQIETLEYKIRSKLISKSQKKFSWLKKSKANKQALKNLEKEEDQPVTKTNKTH
jgi:heme oxygenase